MGLCIYTPNEKNAYVPVNHCTLDGIRLDWQCTEEQIKNQLNRLYDNVDVIQIYHNGKFDYQVLKCTCGWKGRIDWDTMIGARILNENERAGLKGQYIEKIDNSIEKYSIEKLFEGVEYKYVDPYIFALYAATDSFMTYKLYLWQNNSLNYLKIKLKMNLVELYLIVFLK